MTRMRCLPLALVLALSSISAARGDEAKRSATIEDTAGVKTEVTDLRFPRRPRFRALWNGIGVSTKDFEVGISIDDLKSLLVKGDTVEVTYEWLGQEKKLTGRLLSGQLRGGSDFGEFKIEASKLKKLTFASPPPPKSEEAKKKLAESRLRNRATLVLSDGTEVPVSDLRRHDRYYSTEGYIIGGSTRYVHYTDFRFKRGESLVTLEFSKLRSIEFGSENGVTVTLGNGKTATGTLPNEGGAGVDGFTGIYESGEFFIKPEFVKRILFDSPEGSK